MFILHFSGNILCMSKFHEHQLLAANEILPNFQIDLRIFPDHKMNGGS